MLVQTRGDGRNGVSLSAADILNLPAVPEWAGPRLRTLFDLSFWPSSKLWFRALKSRIKAFKPEAILCVMHGWSSAIAAAAGNSLGLPVHLIIHDTPEAALPAPRFIKGWRMTFWIRMCRRATSRICISPYMADEVRRLTGLHTDILYPGLAPCRNLSAEAPQSGNAKQGHSLTFSFIGRIHSGFMPALLGLGRVLERHGHTLVLHSPQAKEFLTNYQPKATVDGGTVPANAVASVLKKEADVTFLPMSFRQEDEQNARMSFPSKLVEYCASGKPVFICAPSYSSIARWIHDRERFSVISESEIEGELEGAVRKLESTSLREELGRAARHLAEGLFSHEATFPHFVEVISRRAA
jgi:Glycosyltransferase Family 4